MVNCQNDPLIDPFTKPLEIHMYPGTAYSGVAGHTPTLPALDEASKKNKS